MSDTVSYAARATDQRVICLRIFADANGETHMQDIDITLLPRKLFNDNPSLRSLILSQLRGATSATYLRACVRWIGTTRRTVCL